MVGSESAARKCDLSIESAVDMQIGIEVGCDVFVRRRQQKARPRAVTLSTDVERHHFRQRAIKGRGELIRHDPFRTLRQRERQSKAVKLTIRQFALRAQHELRFAQPAGGEQPHRLGERQRQCHDEDLVR